MKNFLSFILVLSLLPACTPADDSSTDRATRPVDLSAEILEGDILWSARVPDNWNGTLLLHSRGWSPAPGQADVAPRDLADSLLAMGYALAASNYGAGGWSLAEAVPAQEKTVAAFARRYGNPDRVIGYGYSMGGLVTTALVEKAEPVLDGGISFCSSMGGALGMMNMGLDGAFAFRELVAPDAGIKVVGIADDQANGALVSAAVEEARETPAGRARIALASVLAGIPDWVSANLPRPEGNDADVRFEQVINAFPGGVFLPRSEQEQRTGGVFSWNNGIDYTQQLALSGRQNMIEQLYRIAGISLDEDLAILAAATRIEADPNAVNYMRNNYTPFAEPQVPLLAVQAIGDGITSPSLQEIYAEYAPEAMLNSQYVNRAGHCSFSEEETVASLRQLEARLETGDWPEQAPPFVDHTPAPMLRPCFQGKLCK